MEGSTGVRIQTEIDRHDDGSITLHQSKYVDKLLRRFMPEPPSGLDVDKVLPHSSALPKIIDAICNDPNRDPANPSHPELVKPTQEKCGSLMYLATNTRPDIAYPLNQICRCMANPTPDLVRELDRIFVYLHYNRTIGLTYDAKPTRLTASSDASWETRFSTSAWLIHWQGAVISWGSKKQNCVALSSCESEIIALSEAAKEVVYFRKLLKGIDSSLVPEDRPTELVTDSKAAHDLSYNPEHHARSKHVLRRHFYVRDTVESFEITAPLVKTADNLADFPSKPLLAPRYFELRDAIMNIKGKRSCANNV